MCICTYVCCRSKQSACFCLSGEGGGGGLVWSRFLADTYVCCLLPLLWVISALPPPPNPYSDVRTSLPERPHGIALAKPLGTFSFPPTTIALGTGQELARLRDTLHFIIIIVSVVCATLTWLLFQYFSRCLFLLLLLLLLLLRRRPPHAFLASPTPAITKVSSPGCDDISCRRASLASISPSMILSQAKKSGR